MNRARYILALAALLCGLSVSGQAPWDEAYSLRYERVFKNNIWNSSRNVTGVRQDSISCSFAEVYAKYEEGSLRQSWEGPQGWSAGAVTSSIKHLENISFTGSFSFDQTEGYDMCGSMFIKPGFYPVDVLEFTPGRKSLQTYAFSGGASYNMTESWRIGAKMDFEASNIAKRKDLRHSNSRLEMSVAPGVMYRMGDISIGVSYILEKTSESIEANEVGIAESSYYAFLDKGLMYGVYSVWSGSGIHLKETGIKEFPVKDLSNGAAVQFQYKGLFAEAEYLNRLGTVGEKEYIWFRFPEDRTGALLGYSWQGKTFSQTARMRFGWNRLGLNEYILERVAENGVTTVLNHGISRILSRECIRLAPEYEMVNSYLGMHAGADLVWTKSLSSQIYPYVVGQDLFTYHAYFGLELRMRAFEWGADVAIAGGKVEEETRNMNGSSNPQGKPYRLEEWYQKDIGYQTEGKMFYSGFFRYTFPRNMYVEAGVRMRTKGIRIYRPAYETADPMRMTFELKFGYNF